MDITLHTRLINYIIGFCKKNSRWIQPLEEEGYRVQLIEQMITTDKGNKVKPDVVAVSNKLLNSLVFECKGGVTLKQDQIERYSELSERDLLRWVTYHTEHGTSHDICLVGFEQNYEKLKENNTKNFPIITFSESTIKKNGGSFTKDEVEKKFSSDIDISQKIPTLSYYPFSEDDEKHVIIPYILRTTISLLIKKKTRDKLDSLDESLFADDLVLSQIHPLWDALSIEHRKALKLKVQKIIVELMGTHTKLKDSIESIKKSHSTTAISNLIETCEDVVEAEESTTRITDYH